MYSTWSGRRNLVGSDEVSLVTDASDEADSVQRSLYRSMPTWCFYVGVVCDFKTSSATYASVIEIDVSYLSLTGTLPSSIGYLSSLTVLNLGHNSQNGTIPNNIGYMTSLQLIELYYNQ